jgi:hypothetical protein
MFQMNHVVEACSVFLEHQLDPSNCIGITDFADLTSKIHHNAQLQKNF